MAKMPLRATESMNSLCSFLCVTVRECGLGVDEWIVIPNVAILCNLNYCVFTVDFHASCTSKLGYFLFMCALGRHLKAKLMGVPCISLASPCAGESMWNDLKLFTG